MSTTYDVELNKTDWNNKSGLLIPYSVLDQLNSLGYKKKRIYNYTRVSLKDKLGNLKQYSCCSNSLHALIKEMTEFYITLVETRLQDKTNKEIGYDRLFTRMTRDGETHMDVIYQFSGFNYLFHVPYRKLVQNSILDLREITDKGYRKYWSDFSGSEDKLSFLPKKDNYNHPFFKRLMGQDNNLSNASLVPNDVYLLFFANFWSKNTYHFENPYHKSYTGYENIFLEWVGYELYKQLEESLNSTENRESKLLYLDTTLDLLRLLAMSTHMFFLMFGFYPNLDRDIYLMLCRESSDNQDYSKLSPSPVCDLMGYDDIHLSEELSKYTLESFISQIEKTYLFIGRSVSNFNIHFSKFKRVN